MSSKVAAATVDLSRLWMVTEPSGLTVCPGAVGPIDGVDGEVPLAHGRGSFGSSRGVPVGDRGLERLVDAVLGPGLRERLELDGGRFAAERLVLVADGPHLVEVEEEVRVPAQLLESFVVEPPDRDVRDR
jgi:hypothetical protein